MKITITVSACFVGFWLVACGSADAPNFLHGAGGGARSDGGSQDFVGESHVARVFVTSQEFAPNFGSLENADALCTAAANQAALGGGTTWKAWLSSDETSARDRIVDVSPWTLVDGTTAVFNGTNQFGDDVGALHQIDQDEWGQPPEWYKVGDPSVVVWTGSFLLETAGGCLDWTSTQAGLTATCAQIVQGAGWGGDSSSTCSADCATKHALICFEQP